MHVKPWTHVVTPHADIRHGRLDESVFAADLSDVIARRGPLEYCDAAAFFRKTYATQGLTKLLSAVLGRLSGKGQGEAVIQIQTPFGGGKTHSLIALYHLLVHGEELSKLGLAAEILERAGVDTVPNAAVVTFVGTAADAIKGKTPWGELASQLGQYELLAEHDRKLRAPGKDLLHEVLGKQPTLILMDEIAEYAVKAKDFRDQLVAFFQELTETVKVLPRCVLVVTLPSSAPYGEDGARALHELQQVFKRVENIKTPVEGEEIYEVIRRRLFEDEGNLTEVRRTAEAFVELYQRLGDDLPKAVREPAYRDRIRKAYPFHPELIDVLFERWSTFPDFQRTRGVLRLLANLVSELYQKQHPAPLILPSHIDLTHPGIRNEFLRHIGNEYQGVIASDIAAGGHAKAERIDREMGSEYARFGVASGLARAIFFASFSGGEKRGVGIQRLRLACLQPGLPAAVIGDALARLEDELWYLHVENGTYQFSSQPNLNRVFVEKQEAVQPDQIAEEIRSRLEKLAGSGIRVILCPESSQDVPDTRELKLAILSPDHPYPADSLAAELLGKYGATFRTYRNTLLLLAADAGELSSARQQIQRYLAYCAVAGDKALMRRLSDENRKTLEGKMKDAESSINHQLVSAYRHLARAQEHGVRWLDLGLPTVGVKPLLSARVREYLRAADELLSKIAPQNILRYALGENDKEKPLSEVYSAFLRYPNLPILENEGVFLTSIAQGVRDGVFAVKVGERVYFKEVLPLQQLPDDAVLLREDAVEMPPPRPPNGDTSPGQGKGESEPSPPPSPDGQDHRPSQKPLVSYALKVNVPWDKLSEFIRGVVMPLRQNGAILNVEVSLKAEAERGIQPDILQRTIRETLQQIGATVLDERKG